MKTIYKIGLLALALASQTAGAQVLQTDADASKAQHIMVAKDTVNVAYDAGFNTLPVMSNATDYTVTKKTESADWVNCRKEANGNLTFFSDYNYDNLSKRYATFTLTTADGSYSRNVVVCQGKNESAAKMGDTKIAIASGKASNSQSGYGIEKSYDDDTSTFWHSQWSGGGFPITLTYTIKEASHIDYMTYTPRTDGNSNGNFGNITISYATATAKNSYTTLLSTDLECSSSASTINFGSEGIDDVTSVRIVIKDGGNNFACASEIGFYAKDSSLDKYISQYFTSDLCTELKEGITADNVKTIKNPYLRQLATTLLAGDYSTKYRVGEFSAYENLSTLASRIKTNSYCAYENPAGIYFSKGDKIVVFAEGISDKYPVNLKIKCFSNANDIATEGQPESTYSLMNGANIITAANRGNAYVAYYSNDYQNAPTIKLHFAMATENGYFDLGRGDTDSDWQTLLANAKSDIIDIVTPRMQVAAPLATLKSVCSKNGVKLATIYDEVIRREREVMGMPSQSAEPKNHQFARPVNSGMFADGIGAAASFGSFSEWCNPSSFGFWGFGHELGHVNQVRPDFKWVGCGETTNNIYSSWVEHKLGAKDAYGTGYHRLEDESSGIDDYSGMRGGRFEVYLEEGVRKGVSWQLQDGADYHGTEPTTVTVTGQDENGKSTGSVTTTWRNYDHFVKVVPLYQLMLYTQEVGASPDAFGKMIEGMRKASDTNMTNGKYQLKMMRRFCDSTQVNFLPFFEKAGMLRPIKALIEDYSREWLIITQSQIDELKSYIAGKGYPEAPAALNYINAYNWTVFRDKGALPTDVAVGKGCTASGTKVKVDNNVWTNAVGYETYDADGTLLRISMFGLGDSQKSSRYTYVLFPSGASYIMAVGYDGSKVKIYEK